jgi:hypothetical protein
VLVILNMGQLFGSLRPLGGVSVAADRAGRNLGEVKALVGLLPSYFFWWAKLWLW